MSRRFNYCPQCGTELAEREQGGALRKTCLTDRCGYVFWDNPTPVVAAIVEHEGKIVLARNKAWPGRFFALITGFLEKNEDPAEAVLREVEEELGLKGKVGGFVGHYPFDRMNQLIIAYHVVAEGQIVLNEELAEWKHVPPAELQPWPAATGLALRDWMVSRGYTPPSGDAQLATIRAFLQISPNLATAGQPTAEQFMQLRAAGYDTVINLALPTSSNAIPDEHKVVQSLGMRYVHIPVVWEQPTDADLQAFFAEMDRFAAGGGSERLLVHCALNMRVSAFLFLWRVLRAGMAREEAAKDLVRVWQTDGVWKEFIDRQLAAAAG